MRLGEGICFMDTPDYWGVYDTPVLLAYFFTTGIGKASNALPVSWEASGETIL